MNPRMLRTSALVAALFSGNALAVGFGEIVLLSRIGEPLRAEVPIISSNGEGVESACFSLAAIRGSDLPVVSTARFRLNRSGGNLTLSISGTQPIAEPIFVIGLRAHCGIDLQRDYVLMPSPPLQLAEAGGAAASQRASATPTTRKSRNFREWTARGGETLESIAEGQSAGDLAEQRRLLSAMKRANPDLVETEVLSEGRTVRIPLLARKPAESSTRESFPPQTLADEPPPPPRPKKPAAPKAKPVASATTSPGGGADRIVLGAAPEDIHPELKPPSPTRASAGEVEERMLKLETTLNLLNQEVEKLNSALALTTEALAAQQKLMTAQSLQQPPSNAPALPPPPPAPPTSGGGNWLELLLSALLGGGMAAGIAHLVSRRNTRSREASIILPHAAQPQQTAATTVEPVAAPAVSVPAVSVEPAAAAKAVDIPLEPLATQDIPGSAVRVDYNDGNSALELAEIMLSFGRIRGAAETLAMYIEENAPDNVQPWTMLLDLYRRADMRSDFDSLAAAMRDRFNVRIPTWEESTAPVSGLKSLEDYAHIVWRITNSWGEQECMDYLHELVHDNRAGNRSGFPLEVIEEIVLLMHLLEDAHGVGRPAP